MSEETVNAGTAPADTGNAGIVETATAQEGQDPAPVLNVEDGGESADAPLLSLEDTPPGGEGGEVANTAPENYADFTMPEGFTLADTEREEIHGLFKGMNLSQENAQKLVDMYTKRMSQHRDAAIASELEIRKKWRGEIRSAQDYTRKSAMAQAGFKHLITTDAEKDLFSKDSWLIDHPVIFGIMAKVGGLVAEDNFGGGQQHQGGSKSINAQRFPIDI